MNMSKGLLGRRILLSFVMVVATFAYSFRADNASAAQIVTRSLTLQAGATDGGSKAGGVVNHRFDFALPTAGTVGSIKFEYCTTASNGPCVLPTGTVTTSATLGDESLSAVQGFTMVNTTNGAPYLTRIASAITANDVAILRLDTITNPTTVNQSFFVRISTFASTDTTGSAIDTGTVTASTAEPIVITGVMPESLIFCTGETISTTSGIPDCSTATAGAISFNQLFSPSDTATATSQMSASTNANSGYNISVSGPTLTSGSNTIPAMASAAVGVKGTGQFGMNLVLNTTATSTVAVGLNVAPVSNGTDLKANPAANYATPDTFKFTPSGEVVASSNNGGAGPTNAQIYTSSYIVNVAGSQIAGTYTTTLTYVCTANF